jgi:ABC-type branched-subunit amino acid transport system substrate-binding protein
VAVIIGPSITASAATMIPVCEREQVPLVVTGPAATPLNKWVFLLGAGEARGAEHIAEFAVKTLKARRIAVLHDTGDYGTSGARDLLKSLGTYSGMSARLPSLPGSRPPTPICSYFTQTGLRPR